MVDGKYAIEATIAEGGVGIVVRATHVGLDQRVALKYLKPGALRDRRLVERFEREARLAAQITSEHVVRVQDVGNLGAAGPYIVMEYLVGRGYRRHRRGGAAADPRAVDYVLQACDALAEAHALHIVHRDIKPDNMFVAQRPSNTAILKLIDFGISKEAPRRGAEGDWAHQTGGNERFGTPLYMSPEQLRSAGDVDARTDMWALGIVFFELLTGSPPFEAANVPELCVAILSAEPKRLRSMLPAAPAALEAVIDACLQKDRDKRFRNVAELAQELVPFGGLDASARVGRIKQVVRRGGHSIRPPTPAASFEAQSAHIVITADVARSNPSRTTASNRATPAAAPAAHGNGARRGPRGLGSPRDRGPDSLLERHERDRCPLPTASEVSAPPSAPSAVSVTPTATAPPAPAQPDEPAAAPASSATPAVSPPPVALPRRVSAPAHRRADRHRPARPAAARSSGRGNEAAGARLARPSVRRVARSIREPNPSPEIRRPPPRSCSSRPAPWSSRVACRSLSEVRREPENRPRPRHDAVARRLLRENNGQTASAWATFKEAAADRGRGSMQQARARGA